jgi:hypothetical protein
VSLEASGFTASPWAHNGRIFAISEDGDTFVMQAGPTFRLLGKNTIDGMVLATPATREGALHQNQHPAVSHREGETMTVVAGSSRTWWFLLCGVALVISAIDTGAQTLTLTQVGSIAGPVDLIKAQERLVFIASGKTLTIVDVTDPAAPKRAGTYTFPEMIWGMAPAGTRLYVAADTAGLMILDISNPAAPSLSGSLRTPGQAKNVTLYGAANRALVADHVRGIDIVDLSNRSAPALMGSFFVDGFAKDVVAIGELAFAVDQPSGFTSSTWLRPASSHRRWHTRQPIPLRAQLDVSESPKSVMGVVVGGGPLQIFDLSDVKRPTQVATYRPPGNAQRVALQGERAYVADGPVGLQVLNLSSPASPTSIGSFKTAAPARDVAVTASLVFVAAGSAEVVILRQAP